jgi:protein SCO1/2
MARRGAFFLWNALRPVASRRPARARRSAAPGSARPPRPGIWIALAVGAVALGVVGIAAHPAVQSRLAAVSGQLAAQSIGGPFRLVAADGREVTDRAFRGKWLLVFFGYTRCPDVCPTALDAVARTLDLLGTGAGAIQPLFVSVDSAEDTPEVLRGYTDMFDSRILGLTGAPEQIAAAARAYRVYFRRVEIDGGYAIDHTAIIYVIGPDGRYVTHFGHPAQPDRMARVLRQLVNSH